jgi:serine/threonine-protein kinase
MSPEQATGDRVIDARSDLYSLGALTYEMLTGEPPHTGTTSQAVIARVLTERPRSIRASRPSVPSHVEATVERALEKLPADRWATAKEFSEALTGARSLALTGARLPAVPGLHGVVRDLPITPERPPIVSRRALGIGIAGIVMAAVAGGVGAVAMRKTPVEPQARFVIELPDSLSLVNTRFRQVALSRDGSRAVFNFPVNFPGPLFTRRSGEMQFDAIPGTDSARSMVISPSGSHVLFWIDNGDESRLMKVPIEGGAPVKIADSASVVAQASWGDGDHVLFRRRDHLVLVSADGGPERVVARPDTARKQSALGWPEMLPGGRAALIVIHHGPGNNPDSLYLGAVSLGNGKVVDFGIRGLTPHYASGHVLYVSQDGQLFARPFDARSLSFSGEPRAIARDLSARTTGFPGGARMRGVTDLAVSDVGTILFTDGGSSLATGATSTNRRSIVVQSSRHATWLKVPQLAYLDLRASPDGERLAVTIQDSTNASREDVFVYFFATDQLKRFTRDGMSSRPVWSPDGKRVIWRVTNPGAKPVLRFFSMPWDESEPAVPVPGADGAEAVEFPGPSGKYIAYVRGDSLDTESSTTNSDIFIAPVDSPAAARPFAASGIRERVPRFSPNGKWMAYVGHEVPAMPGSPTQAPILYVRPVPGPGAVTQVSIRNGSTPLWSRDGRSLSYFSGTGPAPLVAARVLESGGFEVASRAEVFRRGAPGTGFANAVARSSTDILPNGSVVYLTNQTAEQPPATTTAVPTLSSQVIAIVNWLGGAHSAPPR